MIKKWAYYNEFDKKKAAWLRELIKRGLIAPGEVDERSIEDVRADDLLGFAQVHAFAGIGIWSYALRLAGIDDDEEVWTGSCPCQPFSAAGAGEGIADERHLWPAWEWLINQCRPRRIYGEQVASKDALNWLDIVLTDLEGQGYACGANDLCAAGVGAPHVRQRLFIAAGRLDDSNGTRPQGYARHGGPARRQEPRRPAAASGILMRLADSSGGQQDWRDTGESAVYYPGCETARHRSNHGSSPTNGFWRAADWLHGRDGKWRPVRPGTFPMDHGIAARMVRCSGYGNAIVAQLAQAFIECSEAAFFDLDNTI